MNLLKKLKKLSTNNIVLILAAVALVYALMNYTSLKSSIFSGMGNANDAAEASHRFKTWEYNLQNL